MELTWQSLGMLVTVGMAVFNTLVGFAKKTAIWDTIKGQMRTVKFTVGTIYAAGLNMYFDGTMTDEMLLSVAPAFVAGSWIGRVVTKKVEKKEG